MRLKAGSISGVRLPLANLAGWREVVEGAVCTAPFSIEASPGATFG